MARLVTDPPDLRAHDGLARGAAATPEAPALTDRDLTVSYAELWRQVVGFAAAITRSGLGRGDRLAVCLDKRVETVVAILGTWAAGAVAVPVNPLSRARQLGHVLDDCAATVLVTSPDRYQALCAESARPGTLRLVVAAGPEPVGGRHESLRWAELVERPPAGPGTVPAGGVDTDMAAILYTSGSTGRPKGVVLSHRNLVLGAQSVAGYLQHGPDDRILAALPLSFDAGLSQLTTAFHAGAHAVLMNYLVPRDVVRICARHAITGLTCVPPLWTALAEQEWPDPATISLRYFANTGGRLARRTLARLRGHFPAAAPYLMYGLTEAFRSTYLDPAEVDRRPDSIGKAIPGAEILVVRADGTRCAPGEVGELVHRGGLVAMGYWNDPERTAERFRPAPDRPGELCTPELAVFSGDLVTADPDGFLYFVGRHDEMIKTSGYRASPTEIEEVAYETGLVRDAVALGVPDDRLGQHVALAVTPPVHGDVDVAALLDELRSRLPRYLLPQRVEVRVALPRSPNGKFDRALLRRDLTASTSGIRS